ETARGGLDAQHRRPCGRASGPPPIKKPPVGGFCTVPREPSTIGTLGPRIAVEPHFSAIMLSAAGTLVYLRKIASEAIKHEAWVQIFQRAEINEIGWNIKRKRHASCHLGSGKIVGQISRKVLL
ncbi:MAG: hypothetical protein ACOH2T_29240, partial [Pseudomonas sp.]